MSRVKAVLRELFGLFVDDGPFTIAIVAWLALAAMILPRLMEEPLWRAGVFVAGLLAVLLESVRRTAKRTT